MRPEAGRCRLSGHGTRGATCALACEVAAPRANAVIPVFDFNANRVPAAVLLPQRCVPEIVLLAQLVRDVRRGRIEIARVADDLGATAAIIRHVAQGADVDAIAAAAAARPTALSG